MRLRLLQLLLLAGTAFAQSDFGELRLTVTDSSGLPVRGRVDVASQATQYARRFVADAEGHIAARRLPYATYTLSASYPGLTPVSQLADVHSAIPIELRITLGVAQMRTAVTVATESALLDTANYASANRIGTATLEDRVTALPGRSLADLVNQEPGWVFEANGILHPRAEEYQVQYVLDGLPLTDNRSVAYVPDFDVDDVQEMSILTAGFPAEYGRKLGGVIEVQTQRDSRSGFHGKAAASGGSFDTTSMYGEGQYGWGRNTFTLSGSGATTYRYLDPPVLQNYTNHGTLADLMAHYERDLTDKDRIGVILRREQSKFQVPDEIVQEQAGQRQDRQSFESAAQFSYDHIFSANVLAFLRAMTRDVTAGYWSNDLSTPMIAGQDRAYHEQYVKVAVSVHSGIQEWKMGGDFDYASLQEALSYRITNPALFDPSTPLTFSFYGHAPDREQSAFAQDEIHWKNLTLSAGLRFDHYSLLVDQSAWSPRAGVSYYLPRANIVFRAAYDRVFQTPPFENLLVSSSPLVTSLSDQVLRLPVQPARGNYYQAGFGRAFFQHIKIDGNFFWRAYRNYPDDDLLLNTGVSFPITFARADIYGAEAKLDIPRWGPFSGYISYSHERGNGYFPVSGGLFLGDEAAQAISAGSTVFPVSQDERNAVRARFRWDVTSRLWAAIGGTYDSGLPIDFDGTYQDAAQYGQAIVDRVNFSDHRPFPLVSVDASLGLTVRRSERYPLRLQVDGTNLSNQINVIDFAGLFSGTAIAPSRSITARLQFGF
ncbi:MAG: TonB-dependent receptor [Bryobacteraceae bacterium]